MSLKINCLALPDLAKREKFKPALSLVELLVVIAIIGIMTAIAVVSLSSGKTQAKLNANAREVASTIKLAQSYALQGKKVNNNIPCGLGFSIIDKDTYRIFYQKKDDCASYNKDPNESELNAHETFDLKDGVEFDEGVIGSRIYFTLAHGNIFIFNKSNNAISSLSIGFKAPDGTTKTVSVSATGEITEQ